MATAVFALKLAIAVGAIAFGSWLSGRRPELAGFIVALPLASLLALAFSYLEHRDSEASIVFAKSILVGVPISYLFFLPFFFAERLGYGFSVSYLAGVILLILGFFIHRILIAAIG